jgi:hypothetical protein
MNAARNRGAFKGRMRPAGPASNAFAAKSATVRIRDFKRASIGSVTSIAPAPNRAWCPKRQIRARAVAVDYRSDSKGLVMA